jgi:hypothetical protein
MKTNKSFFCLISAALLLLPGCIKDPTYQSKPLKSTFKTFTNNQTEKNISLEVKRLTPQEIHFLFGSSDQILIKNIVILNFSINNHSNSHYILTPQDIAIKSLNCSDVIKLTKKPGNFFQRIGKIIFSFYSLSFLFGSLKNVTNKEMCHKEGSVVAFFTAITLLTIPATITFIIQGIKSAIKNRKLKKELKEKIIDAKITIKPQQQHAGLLFIQSSNYKPIFTLAMHEENNLSNIITFNIDLSKK